MALHLRGPITLATYSDAPGTVPQTSFNDANGLTCYTAGVDSFMARGVLFEVIDSVGSKAPTVAAASGLMSANATGWVTGNENFCGLKTQTGLTANFWTLASPARIWVVPQLVVIVQPPPLIAAHKVRLVITTAAGAASFTPTIRAWVLTDEVIAYPAA